MSGEFTWNVPRQFRTNVHSSDGVRRYRSIPYMPEQVKNPPTVDKLLANRAAAILGDHYVLPSRSVADRERRHSRGICARRNRNRPIRRQRSDRNRGGRSASPRRRFVENRYNVPYVPYVQSIGAEPVRNRAMTVRLEISSPPASGVPLRITTAPSMPPLNCAARLLDYTGGVVTFNWTLVISWTGAGTQTRGEFTGRTTATNSAVTTWSPPLGDQCFGGEVSITVAASTTGGASYHQHVSPVRIVGTQPPEADILTALGTAPWYIRRIARRESALTQFNAAGAPLLNTTGDGGAGILQITGAHQTAQDVWNWRHNIATGQGILAGNSAAANTFWNRQVSQFNAWNAAHPTAQVAAPADVTYGTITFSYPTGTNHSFADAIAIKMFNGAHRHFISWNNVGAFATHPAWSLNTTNNLGRNYVQNVCNTAG